MKPKTIKVAGRVWTVLIMSYGETWESWSTEDGHLSVMRGSYEVLKADDLIEAIYPTRKRYWLYWRSGVGHSRARWTSKTGATIAAIRASKVRGR